MAKIVKTCWLTVDGEPVYVEKKKIKHMYLRVAKPDGTIRISAPAGMSDRQISRFVKEKRDWIRQARQRVRQSEEKVLTPEEKREQTEAYRQQLLAILPQVIETCEAVTGLHANEWKLRDMKTRWGSCNVEKKRIWLNTQLAAYPRECLEYVVTHELVHLLERGHNQVFWGYMDRYFPRWRQVRKMLRQGE